MKTKASRTLPPARVDQLIVKELTDEVLVYDLKRHSAHCLNKTSALIWKHCDGKTSIAQMTGVLERELTDAHVDEDVIWLALRQLRRFHLLEEQSENFAMLKVTRRDLVRKYLPAALILPLILSVPAPTAAQAASGACAAATNRPNGCPCTSFTQCQSNCCTNFGPVGGFTCQPPAVC